VDALLFGAKLFFYQFYDLLTEIRVG